MQSPPIIGLAEGMKAQLGPAMTLIGQNQQRRIEKKLFRLGHRDAMLLVLPRVTPIPFEANDFR
jgi:hypothetical protein